MVTKTKLCDANYQAIYEEALESAKKAEQDFMDKHGEPFYCGFAWVEIGNGRHPFVNFMKKHHADKISKHWHKGAVIWNPAGNSTQSMDIKEQGAIAFERVLDKHGIPAMACSRAD